MRDPAPLSRPQALPCATPKRSEEPLSRTLQPRAPPRAARFFPSAQTSPTRAPAERSSPGVLPHPLGRLTRSPAPAEPATGPRRPARSTAPEYSARMTQRTRALLLHLRSLVHHARRAPVVESVRLSQKRLLRPEMEGCMSEHQR